MGNNRKLVLIGGGGHCESVLDTVRRNGVFSEIVILDQNLPVGTDIMGCIVVGGDEKMSDLYSRGFSFAFITVGSIQSTKQRQRIYKKAINTGFMFPNIIDPSAIISDNRKIGTGIFVGKGVVINAGVVIKDMAIINTGAIIEHDCYVGAFSHIAVGAVVCGNCEISESSFIGANATIIQGVKIGKNSVIGAGSIVLRNVPDNGRIVGIWSGNKQVILPDINM